MNRYEKYKDSGIPWTPEIPVSWDIRYGKWVLNLMQRAVRDDDEVVTCFRDGEVILRTLRRTDGFTMSDKEIGYQGVNIGDIVIHGMDGFAGAMGISKSQGKSTPVYVVCTTKNNHNARYIIYYLRSLAHNDVFLSLSTGIRERSCDLKWNKISVLPFILPDHFEQRAIADFLDVKCAEVDELIALQEKMIDELKVYKQSVITEAVTKGLNPDAPLKDSGIEWIGQIPTHWSTERLKFYAKSKYDRNQESLECDYIGLENIVSYSLSFIESASDYDKSQSILCKAGDVIFGKLRPYLAKVFLVDKTSCCSSEFAVFTDVPYPEYLKYLLISDWFIKIVDASTYGTKMPRANIDFIKNMDITIPPISEQQQIADYLDKKCAEIDEMTSIKQQKIEQLKEYKKSIIYEYVTGKKQVNIE